MGNDPRRYVIFQDNCCVVLTSRFPTSSSNCLGTKLMWTRDQLMHLSHSPLSRSPFTLPAEVNFLGKGAPVPEDHCEDDSEESGEHNQTNTSTVRIYTQQPFCTCTYMSKGATTEPRHRRWCLSNGFLTTELVWWKRFYCIGEKKVIWT